MGRKNSEIKEQKRNSKENREEEKENSHKYSNFLQTYFQLNDVSYKEIGSIYTNPRSQFVHVHNLNTSYKNMEIVKYGSLMHGWWVDVW